jgi:hypothetical protein
LGEASLETVDVGIVGRARNVHVQEGVETVQDVIAIFGRSDAFVLVLAAVVIDSQTECAVLI